jgi:hypothetical protein
LPSNTKEGEDIRKSVKGARCYHIDYGFESSQFQEIIGDKLTNEILNLPFEKLEKQKITSNISYNSIIDYELDLDVVSLYATSLKNLPYPTNCSNHYTFEEIDEQIIDELRNEKVLGIVKVNINFINKYKFPFTFTS